MRFNPLVRFGILKFDIPSLLALSDFPEIDISLNYYEAKRGLEEKIP